jgi:hypothetical protein
MPFSLMPSSLTGETKRGGTISKKPFAIVYLNSINNAMRAVNPDPGQEKKY